MKTQIPQMNKKNKVTVPFYSPPSRLNGQTPAEIIKEARAAVMSSSAIGIKPVFTNRPFTPKERERKLFGNVKTKSSRPPSSFSLKYLEGQEIGSRVKLPSIEVVQKRRTHSNFRSSNNLSLDNLTEDHDAEALEEIGDIDYERLKTWKKSHSCPKEGRMVRAASYNELNSRIFTDERKWDGFVQDNRVRSNELSKIRLPARRESSKEAKRSVKNTYRYLSLSKGSGDYEESEDFQDKSFEDETDFTHQVTNNQEKGDINSKSNQNENSLLELAEDKKNLETEHNIPQNEETNQKVEEIVDALVEHTENQKKAEIEPEAPKDQVLKSEPNIKNEQSEKSVATEPKSEYLKALKEGYSNFNLFKQSSPSHSEIAELYETARYYEENVEKSSQLRPNDSIPTKDVRNTFAKKSEESSCIRNLDLAKENLNKIGERIKTLNKELAHKSETKVSSTKTSSDNIQFEMNNKKRYHTVTEKGGPKEKAYVKWNNKMQMNHPLPHESISNESWDIFWKNSYFKTKEEEDDDDDEDDEDNEDYAQETEKPQKPSDLDYIRRLINKVTGLFKLRAENQDVYETLCQFYLLLKNTETTLENDVKLKITKSLYLYIDNEDPKILLSLARILFYLKVESNLSVACKIIFKVARSDANDHLFLNEEDILELFMEGIGRASPLESAESCVYGYGALKFLTMNHNILSRILNMGALDLMTLHLKIINNAHIENGSVGEQTQHALFQLTGALRHIAAGEGALSLFITTNCIAIICKTLQLFQKEEDIVTNISRTLSLLSTDENVIQVLMSVENVLTMVTDLLDRYIENDKILIRLSFTLGNIVEHSDLARVQLSRNDTALTSLLNLLKYYIDKDLEISMKEDKNRNPSELNSETIDDIIVKVIRIIANMSMNPIVGSNLSPTTNEKKSIQLSKLLTILLMRKDPGITLLATLGCLNNISYYCNSHSILIDIAQGIERVLGLPSEDCQAEAARVLGNLTRHQEIRDLIYNTGGVNQLINLITSQDQEVVRCACGALVNMMLDAETRRHFLESHGIDKLVRALEVFSNDWSLASLAARAIWNSCADNMSLAMLHNDVEHLMNILANSLEEENWNDGDAAWEEFASIATDLLEKINSHLESP